MEDKIKEDIFELIYNYSKNNQIVDSEYIEKLIFIIESNRKLGNYLNNVIITPIYRYEKDRKIAASYDALTKDIWVYYETIGNLIQEYTKYEILFDDFEKNMFRNLIITQIILHELEHVKQTKECDMNKEDSDEIKLITEGLSYSKIKLDIDNKSFYSKRKQNKYLDTQRELYEKYYKFNPSERLAEINSFVTILKVISERLNSIANLTDFINTQFIESLLSGYYESLKQNSCPSEIYLSGYDKKEIWTGFDFYDENESKLLKNVSNKYNLTKRLALGLPVDYQEYNFLVMQLRKTRKYNI